MSGTGKRLTWHEPRADAGQGRAGSIRLFHYTWDDSKRHPGQPYVMRTDLPGYEGGTWRSGDPGSLKETAEEIFAAWLKAVGVLAETADGEAALDAAFRTWYAADETDIGPDLEWCAVEGFEAGWRARGGVQ